VTNHMVKDLFIEKYGCRNTPHANKIALMMRLCESLDNPSKLRRGIEYRKR
jgi:hypothetical protein